MMASQARTTTEDQYLTDGGIVVTRQIDTLPLDTALDAVLDEIDAHKGAVFASGYEFPGRYSRWDMAFIHPPVELLGFGRRFEFRALNERGVELLKMLHDILQGHPHLADLSLEAERLAGAIIPMPERFPEEERSKQPTVFSILRAVIGEMHSAREPHIGFYGAMGYDLVFQFEPIERRHPREGAAPDLHLYLPDELIIVDHRKEVATRRRYDFRGRGGRTHGIPRESKPIPPVRGEHSEVVSDHGPGEYAEKVRNIIHGCRMGDFFEVVLSQVFSTGYPGTPRELFETIRRTNPSPYEFLINLGTEQLVGASPEMFVRVEGAQVETCPISGTIRRGRTPMEDAANILELLNSKKDEAELTMCTDVDRNDKSRICKPGTVQVKGRRLIEIYSRLIHTVDHVVGQLRDDCDGLDALLSHMWACTLTGSPKPAAMQRIEDLENSPRGWYGGCVGFLGFDGTVNTGITIRTVLLKQGRASVRAGATLLVDSDPDSEERETRTKAEAFLSAVVEGLPAEPAPASPIRATGRGKRILFVDCRDSFVHTLANYVRQTGAEVKTYRAGFPLSVLDEEKPDLVFISPGPGRPEDFALPDLVGAAVERGLPVFGVCLGHQGIWQHFGGRLGLLDYPMHGKPSDIFVEKATGIFEGFPPCFQAGRYHSLYAEEPSLPEGLEVTARTADGVVMAVRHRNLPVASVQFHPESILTLGDNLGLRLIANTVAALTA